MRVVKKFGGSSVATIEQIKLIAEEIKKDYESGVEQVIVVSAMGKTTNELIEIAQSCEQIVNKEHLDFLLCTGEMKTVALLAMCLDDLGIKSECFTGLQAGVVTNSVFGNAFIKELKKNKIENCLKQKIVAIVAGFQGVTDDGVLTTLGRGGSDTTAVALSVALNAECVINTDVENVCFFDPRIISKARPIKKLNFNNALELSFGGAKVLDFRCLEIAKKYNKKILLKKTLSSKGGTEILSGLNFEDLSVVGISCKRGLNLVCNKDKNFCKVFESLCGNANVDLFSVSSKGIYYMQNTKNGNLTIKTKNINVIENVAKITIAGNGFATHKSDLKNILFLLKKQKIELLHFYVSQNYIHLVVYDNISEDVCKMLVKLLGGEKNV